MEEERLRVLLVEDEGSLREPLAKRLRDAHGYRVDTAANAAEAWQLITEASRPYDVALIDDLLTPEPGVEPEPMGIELMEKIRKHYPETECIVFTGWGMDRAMEALQAGAYRYLAKPLNLDELGMTVLMAAEQTRLRRERDLLSATLGISNAMVSGLDVGKTLEVIAETIPKLVGAEACAVAQVASATGRVWYKPMIMLGDATVRWHWHMKGVSLTRQIIETGQPLVLSDVDAHAEEVDENLRRAGVKSFVGVPIPGEPENWGVLYAYSTRREAFGTHEQRVLQLLAGQTAIALENARLFEAETRRRQEAETLRETALALTTTLEQQEIFERILSELQKVLPYDSASVQLLKGDRLEIIGGHGFPNLPEILGLSFPVDGDNPNREVVRRKDYFIVPDAPAVYEDFSKEPHVQAGIRSWLGVPMLVGDRLTGMIALDKRQSGFYTEEHARLAQTFAAQAALAIENGRLFDEVKHRARNLETLQDLALTVNSSLDLDETLKRACQAAVEFFNADHSGLVLFEPGYVHGCVKAEYPASGTLGTIIPLQGVPAEERLTKTKEPLIISDVASDKSLGPVRDILLGFDIQSILIVPVASKSGNLLGSFSLDAMGRTKQFMVEEVRLCQVFAAHVAVAVENAQLFSELSEAKEWREALIENAFDAVIAIDQNRKITVFNQRAEEMLGWTAGEMIGQTVSRLHVDVGRARAIFDVVNREGTVSGWGVELKRRDGTHIPALLSATLIRDSQGHPIGQAGFIRDLRQVNLLEERLRTLIRVSQAITGTLELDEVLDLIAESATVAFPAAQSGAIHLYDESTDILRVRVNTFGYSAEAIEALSLAVGEGIAGWVFQHQRPLVVDDTRRDPRYKRIDHPELEVHRSMICVPLRVKDHVIGTLSLNNSDVTRAFHLEDLGLLSSFADQAAIAIENARRMQELEQMRQAAEAMARTIEPRQALQQIVESAAQVLQADSSAVWSYDEVRDKFIPEELVAVGIPRQDLEEFRKEEPKPGGTARTIMKEGYVAVTDISKSDIGFLGDTTQGLLDRIGARSFQGVSLGVRDERLGVLYANYSRPRTLGKDEEAALRTFANHAALALKSARLLAKMQQTREAAGVIAGVTVQEDLSQTLRTIVQHTRRVLRSDGVTLYSYDEATEQFGEWAKEIVDARDPDSARRPDELTAKSVVWSILRLTEPPYYCLANDHVFQHELLDGHFVRVENIRAVIGIQLRVGERKVGVMFVNFRSPHRFTLDEIATIQLFADQAAMAIQNARQYAEIVRDARLREGLLQAGQEIMALQEPEAVLQNVVDIMREVLACDVVTLYSYDQDRGEIDFPAYIAGKLRSPASLQELGYVSEDSVVGQLLALGEPHFADDAPCDSLMSAGGFVGREGIQSSAGIPLKSGDQVIGIVFVNYRTAHPFPLQEREALLLFATQVAIAVQNAFQYDELEKTKESLAARTSVAWIGMVSSVWRHAIEKHALTIREQIQLLRLEMQKSPPRSSSIWEKLDVIERLADQILEKPMTPPLSTEEGVSSIPVNEFVRERARQLWTVEPCKSVSLRLDLGLDEVATVRASPEWLRRALDILVDNAVEAMSDLPRSQITITSRSIGNQAKIAVTDVGRGIPEEIQAKLFREPIPKPKGAKGLGLGLLIAQTIVQAYGGEIFLDRTDSSGTTMMISLTLETGA